MNTASMRPAEFDTLPVREKAEFIALNRATNTMQDYERHLTEKKNRRKGSGRQHG